MPFGFHNDYLFNPHAIYGGFATALTGPHRFNKSDYTGPELQGRDQFAGHTGLFITASVLPVGQFHRIRVKSETDPMRAAINYTSEAMSLIGCLRPPYYPERAFNQGNVGRIFVYAGSALNPPRPACFGSPIDAVTGLVYLGSPKGRGRGDPNPGPRDCAPITTESDGKATEQQKGPRWHEAF